MSILTGKEALIALANDSEVEFMISGISSWDSLSSCNGFNLMNFKDADFKFRLKPHTITINGIEVPAPFKPKAGEQAFYITAFGNYDALVFDWQLNDFGYWRTEEEIKQVVAALRKCLEVLNEHAR